ncbi:MAG: Ig-like domain-containing protein, partial [Myxococcaceae bacterium]|nr:Ig-like domain-containing protein [Myxococcaceae bacterium]
MKALQVTALAALLAACSGGGGGGTAGGTGGTSGGRGGMAGGTANAGGTGGGQSGATLMSLAITPATVTLGVPDTQQLTATGTYSDGSTRDVTPAATWSTSAMATATVTPAGLVTAAADGMATLTAALDGKTATAVVTVSGPAVSKVEVTPAMISLGVGQAVPFVATATFADMTTRNVSAESTWSSSAMATATVSPAGTVTAVAPGMSTIEATFRGKKGSVMTTVSTKTVTKLVIFPPHLVTANGQSRQLEATATYSDGSTAPVTNAVTWSVDGMGQASVVSPGGLYTADSMVGSVRVRAALQGVEAFMRTYITSPGFDLVGLIYNPENIPRGLTFNGQLPTANFGGVASTNFGYVVWSSGSPGVVEIQPTGGWKGVSVGSSVMTATTYTASGMLTVSGTVMVTEPTPDSITVANGATGAATLAQGTTLQLTATGQSAIFPQLNADLSAQVMWSTSNAAAVTVDAMGLARGVGAGTATITARLGATTGTTTLTVPVTAPPEMTLTLSPTEDNSVILSSISPAAQTTVYSTNALFMSPGVAVGCTWFWNPPIGPAPE